MLRGVGENAEHKIEDETDMFRKSFLRHDPRGIKYFLDVAPLTYLLRRESPERGTY